MLQKGKIPFGAAQKHSLPVRAHARQCKQASTESNINFMKYTRLGSTGLKVSKLCLGCMTYGVPHRGAHPWTLDEEASRPFLRRALDLGITFFDTANTYSDGTSEEIVGRAL